MKKFIGIVLLLAVAFIFISCSSVQNNSSTQDNSNTLMGDVKASEANISQNNMENNTIVEFETYDMNSSIVNSAKLFSNKKLTLLNIWATWCGPCINEIPELEKINEKYENVQVVGLTIDVPSQTEVSEAKKLLDNLNATYLVLQTNEKLTKEFNVQFVPTSYFIDETGHIVSKEIVGADIKQYTDFIEEYLGETN